MARTAALNARFDRLRLDVVHGAPEGFDRLRAAARDQTARNMDRLADDLASEPCPSASPGCALFAARQETGALVGVGGVAEDGGTLRPAMPHGSRTARLPTINARAAPGAVPFWTGMGFHPVDGVAVAHLRWSP